MSLLEEFNRIDLNKISEYISIQQEEHLTLDFKTLNSPEISRDDRKNLAKAISGFANSSGGIIVWGVDARKNKDGIDCASDLTEVENAKLALSKLNEYTGRATAPIVEGVCHRALITNDPKGILLSFVPESDIGPHMAKFGEDRYYKLSGDSFYKMEHFDIEDMFGRRKKPVLSLEYYKHANREITISIRNDGKGSALSPYLAVDLPTELKVSSYGVDGNRNWNLPLVYSKNRKIFGANTTFVIHPGASIDVFMLEGKGNKTIQGRYDIKYELACDGVPSKEGTLVIKEG